VGVASYPLHGHSSRDLTRAADAAMYQVKQEGGNRVRVAMPADQAEDGERSGSGSPH
jgi:PleD family two-component response regulator